MRKEERNNVIRDYTIGIIGVLLIILIFMATWLGKLVALIVGVFALIEIIEIKAAVKKVLEKGRPRNVLTINMIFFRSILIILMIVSWSEIAFSNNYNLKYTYFIAFLTIVAEIINFEVRNTIKSHFKKKERNEKNNFIAGILGMSVWVLLIAFYSYNFSQDYIRPKQQLTLINLKVPQGISIYRHDKAQSNSYVEKPIASITSKEELERIIKELKGEKVTNITAIDKLNYERMKANNYPYYQMIFSYIDDGSKLGELNKGYVDSIILTSNRFAVIEQLNITNSITGAHSYYESYKILLSKETMDMIFSKLP